MPRFRKKQAAAASSSESSGSEEDESGSSGSDGEEDSISSSDDGSRSDSDSDSDSSRESSDNDEKGGGDDEDEDEASGSYDPMNDALDALIDSVAEYEDPEECWDLVREWLQDHSIEETKEAMEMKGEFDTTALHVACRNHPPLDVVEIMLMAAPDMIFWADSFGWIPLHYACANGTDIAVVRLLLSRYPDSKLVVDKRGRTPLHFALGNAENPPTPPLVKLLAGEMGESTKWPDENAMLPIHYACAYGATVEVLTVLIHAWGESMQKTDSKGRIPLHYAMGNSHLKNSPHLVKCLLHLMPSCIDQLDAEKNLPLDLLSTKAESVEEEEFEARDAILMCLTHYLEAGPKTSIEFLTGIKKLPEWVRESAVIHPAVQTMLNNKISSRFPTMILMLDFYFLAAVIGFFVITSNQSINRRFNKQNDGDFTVNGRAVSAALLSPLYLGAIYFSGREITQMISVRHSTTFFAYALDSENFINLTFIIMTIVCTALMQTGKGDDNMFANVAAITTGFQGMQVLAYLKSILIEFAVFVSSVTFVTARLFSFLAMLVITLLMFSQMWYTLFRQALPCNELDGENEMNATDDALNMMDDFFEYESLEEDIECEFSIEQPYCTNMFW